MCHATPTTCIWSKILNKKGAHPSFHTLRYYDSINLETHQLVNKVTKLIQATKIWGLPTIVAMNL
jgi:hypothetical protein